MRKELLNQRPTSALRGQSPLCESVGTGHTSTHPSIFTKVLLVLLAMLLLPSTAWADYTYGGEALTFYRMNDSNPSYYYSGSEDNKTIEWNANTSAGYESNQSAYTSFTDLRFTYANSLTGLLNNITIVGNNTESALQDATIKVYKLTTPDATDETQRTQIGTISNEGATYTYTPTEGVQGFNNEYIQLAIVPTGDNQRFYTNQIKSITLTFSGTEYDLYVGDYHVTSYNASNVLGNGTVSYDADTKKLTLTNATLKKESVQEGVTIIIPTEISSNFESEQLTIDLVGTNKLYGFISDDSRAGTLKFTGTGSLEITNHDGTISGYTDVDFGSFKLKSNSPGINYGEAGGVQDFHRLQDYTKDKPVTNVIITTETVYPIWVYDVAGDDNRHFLQLTYDNKDNVLGDGYSSVSYNGNGTLTIKGAQTSSQDYPSFVIDKDISALTVHLVGYNQVGGAGKNAFQFLGTNTALQFTTSETLPGSLHYFGNLASGVSGDIDYKNGLEHNATDKKISATISNLNFSPFTGFVSDINEEVNKTYIYSSNKSWYASKAELNHVAPIYVTVSPRSGGTSTSMWPTELSNPSYISKVLFQFDWGACTNTNVTVQVKGLTTGGELDGETYSEPIALSTANADGIVVIELNKAVTSANLQLVFTSESDFSIVPLSVGFKETTYDLIVGETTVSMANKDDVLDNGTVSFTPATGTTSAKLILNGASVPKITSGLEALTIEINRESSVGYIDTNSATDGDKTLTITKGSDNSSLSLSADQEHSVIEGFKSVSVGEGIYVQSDNPCVYSTSNKRYEATDAALISSLTFTTTKYYPLWVTQHTTTINTYQVNDDSKDYILGTDITSVQFNGTTNTLTFVENEDLYMNSCVYVTSGLDALTIAINGSCKLSSFNKGDTTPAITSVNPDAPLTIALAEGATSGDLALISVQGKAISGFKSLTHTGLLNLTDGASYSTDNLQWSASEAAFATEIKKPTIEINYSDKYFSINNPNAGGCGGTLMLKTVKMTNEGKVEDDEEEIKGSYAQKYKYGIAIWKYWVKANDNESDPIYVCRLGLEDVEVTYGDTEIPTPNILPENIDGVSLSYSTEDYEADVAEVVEGTITIKSTGRQPIDATFSNIPDDYTFLTDEENGTPEASFSLLVKPQEPTLSLESGTYVGTQTIEVGNISPNATAKYYTYEGENAPDNPEVSVVPENHKIEIASSKTLVVYSETEYDIDDDNTGYLTSETVSATYTILKDISLCTVTPEEATYTGEAIELVVKASETGTTATTLTEGTDYTVSYQKVTGETATDVESMIDAGTYKITITGKGNYGGTKEISKFQIAQASLEDAAISKLIVGDKEYTSEVDKVIEIPYTGEAIQPEVDVIFNDGTVDASEYTVSYGENNTEISTTPLASVTVTSTNNNFEEGTFKSLNFKIVPAPVTITAEAQTVTYNAKQQAYTGASVNNENAALVIAYYTSEEERTTGSNALTGAPTDAGTYYVSVTLNEESQQHYTAEPANVTFTIAQLDIADAVITLDKEELTYNGEVQSVTVEKVMVGDIEVAAEYYEVSGNSGTEARNYTLTVTAKLKNSDGSDFKNNFKGSAEKAWKINHRTASAEELGFKSETQTASTYYNSDEDFNLPEGYVAYIITGINGNSVTTQRVSYIPKGVAVLVEKGQSSESPNDATPYPSTLPLKGTQEPVDVTSITGGTVYVLYNGEFVKSTSGTIPAHRCYLLIPDQIASGTRSFGIDHGDGTTALREVKGEKWADGEWYTLQGQRIAKPAKGLYILNGKKVVIK